MFSNGTQLQNSFLGRVNSLVTRVETLAEGWLTSTLKRIIPDRFFSQPTPAVSLTAITQSGDTQPLSAGALSDKHALLARFDNAVKLGHHPEGTIYMEPLSKTASATTHAPRVPTLPPTGSPLASERASMITSPDRATLVSKSTSTNPAYFFPDIAGYTITRFLGEGGEASVYEAIAPNGHKVAIKHFHRLSGRENTEFFISALGGEGTGIVKAMDRLVDSEGNTYGIVFELMEKGTLDSNLGRIHSLQNRYLATGNSQQTTILKGMLARWMRQVANGVSSLHARGIIHRDIKPSNIYISADNEACIADMGTVLCGNKKPSQGIVVSKDFTAPEVGLSLVVSPQGHTFFHVVPTYINESGEKVPVEQATGMALKHTLGLPSVFAMSNGQPIQGAFDLFGDINPTTPAIMESDVTTRSDVFSLGQTFAEMLLGENQFDQVANQPRYVFIQAIAVACRLWGFDSTLADVIIKATEPLPWNRYLSAEELSSDLNAALNRSLQGPVKKRPSPGLTHAYGASDLARNGAPTMDVLPALV